jgi:hypothetical protein
MPSRSASEPDRAPPASRVGEHPIDDAGAPTGNSENSGARAAERPRQSRDVLTSGGWCAQRGAGRLPARRLGTSYRWLKVKSASEPADLSDKFYPTGR